MRRRSAVDSAGMPAALLKPTPRHVQVNALGGTMMLIAAALVVHRYLGRHRAQEARRDGRTARRPVRVRAHRHGWRRGPAAQARRRRRPSHHRSLPVCRARPGTDGTDNAAARRARKVCGGIAGRGLVSRDRTRSELARWLLAPSRSRAGRRQSCRSDAVCPR